MDILDVVRRRAWDSRYYEVSDAAKAVPTMLTPEDGKMLCWLGEHYFQSKGAVVDLGCFLGGSTASLASGLERSGRPWTIHSYDRFRTEEFGKLKRLRLSGFAEPEGKDFFSLFEKHVQSFAPNVVPHRGEVESHPWTGAPIEILSLHAAQSVEALDFLLRQFFSCLIPGHSIIVAPCNNWFFQTPWMITTMELLRPKIELVGWTRYYLSMFRCNDVPDARDMERIRFDRLSQPEVEALILRARDRFPFESQRELYAMALDTYRLTPNARQTKDLKPPNWASKPTTGWWS